MWLFLLKYWKQVGIGFAIISVVLGIYLKGKSDCRRAIEGALAREQARIFEAVEREREKANKVRSRIDASRRENPVDDVRDSCLLSSDPISVECVP